MPFGERNDGSWGIKAPDLGNSYISDRPVVEAIKDALPATLLLACVAILFACLVGVAVGLVIAVYCPNKIGDLILSICALGMSVPSFCCRNTGCMVVWLPSALLYWSSYDWWASGC